MNKILALVIVLVASVASFALTSTSIAAGFFDKNGKPSNVAIYQLGTGTSAQYDTLAAGAQNVYGPFNLSIDPSRPQFKGLRACAVTNTFQSGDSVEFAYQLINGSTLADTTPIWTAVDTFINTGKVGAYADLSSKVGQNIVFKLKNIGAGATIVARKFRVALQGPSSEFVDIKR